MINLIILVNKKWPIYEYIDLNMNILQYKST